MQISILPQLLTVAGHCRLRNLRPYVITSTEKNVAEGAACAGELILGNIFLKLSGLGVRDFISNRIE